MELNERIKKGNELNITFENVLMKTEKGNSDTGASFITFKWIDSVSLSFFQLKFIEKYFFLCRNKATPVDFNVYVCVLKNSASSFFRIEL